PKGPGVRHDGGIYGGWDVPIYYDPILAKLIVWAETREAACRRMLSAMDDYVILGIKTNIPFLKEIISHPSFLEGATTTGFIKSHFEGWEEKEGPEERLTMALAAAAFFDSRRTREAGFPSLRTKEAFSPWRALGKWRIGEKSD
ncbi:MAG: acetyl-CoA carboxylase biotin carboxylase subunit, partial [Candidatus Aminicenantes bacterium]|nr:acetyl-CoA carboxylase biotin carboxylase subunit [Candidatus Aminicenantes bacterium]